MTIFQYVKWSELERLGEPNDVMVKVWSIAAVSALALMGAATTAYAQNKPRVQAPTDFTVRADASGRDNQFGQADGRRTLTWDAKKGRWGLTLDIKPRTEVDPQLRDSQGRDVEAGAFFKLTPQLRVGGAVGIGPNQPTPIRKNDGREETPRVRLETAFKF